MNILSVTEVGARIASLLRGDELLADLWVRGEIVNLTRSAAGHFYFSLRDEQSLIRCVLFRGSAARLATRPENGAAVVLHGRTEFYGPSGGLQVIADLLFPEGLGAAQIQFEALRLRLEDEGLFAPERKRPLPPFPRRIGVVTSSSGAVIHDIFTVLQRRYPLAEILLASTSVQGERAPIEIQRAIERLSALHREGTALSAVIVARGGGSAQELAAFNDERVVRAIFGCPVPVISAVGHETDVTLADLVADLRAATPSAAAELVAPDVAVLRDVISVLRARLTTEAQSIQDIRVQELKLERRRLQALSPSARILEQREACSLLLDRAAVGARHATTLARIGIDARAQQLVALSPLRTLDRGYAICRLESGVVVHSIGQVEAGTRIDITVSDGSFGARAGGDRRATLSAPPPG